MAAVAVPEAVAVLVAAEPVAVQVLEVQALAVQVVQVQAVMVAQQVQVETEGLQIVVVPEIVLLHPPIPLLVMLL